MVKQLLKSRGEEAAYVCYVTVKKPTKKKTIAKVGSSGVTEYESGMFVSVQGILIIGLYRILLLTENGKV